MQEDPGGRLALSAPENVSNTDERSQGRWWERVFVHLLAHCSIFLQLKKVHMGQQGLGSSTGSYSLSSSISFTFECESKEQHSSNEATANTKERKTPNKHMSSFF